MNAKLIGFFSGFPTRHFTDNIAEVLNENLDVRESLVFISTWPNNYVQNDEDSDGMHNMFAEKNMTYEGLGFADLTIKAHYPLEDDLLQTR